MPKPDGHSGGRPTVRRMIASDLDSVVELHLASFPDYFITSLGEQFLYEFYREALDEIALVALIDGRVVGTQLTFVRPSRTFRHMITRRGLKFARLAAPAAARGFWPALRVGLGILKPLHAWRRKGEAIAMFTAVDASVRGKGVARLLLKRMIAEAEIARISVIHGENEDDPRLNHLYESIGFAKAGVTHLQIGPSKVKMAARVKDAVALLAADPDFIAAAAEAAQRTEFTTQRAAHAAI